MRHFAVSKNLKSLAINNKVVTKEMLDGKYKKFAKFTAFPFRDVEVMHLSHIMGRTDLPKPFRYIYKWPGFVPMTHQVDAAQHIVYHNRAFLWLDIGTGKTYTAIGAMDYAMKHHGVSKVLILTPKSTMNVVWGDELFRAMPKLKPAIIEGVAAKKRELLQSGAKVDVLNHDGLRNLKDILLKNKYDLIIVDEQTAFKNWTAARTKVLRLLLANPKVRLWMLSGEPMPQSPMDMYAPGRLVCGENFPKTKTSFQNRTMTQFGQWTWRPKDDAHEIIAEMVGHYAYRLSRDECIDLPPTTYDTREVPATKQQEKIAKQLRLEAAAEIEDGVITAANEGVHMIRLLQTASGAVVRENIETGKRTATAVDCKPKFEALEDILDATHGPVIVFCSYLAPLTVVERWLKERKITYARVDGSTSGKKRTQAFRDVQDDKIKVLLANPAAMAHGITLTTSNTIVWWGLPFSNEVFGQANGRIVRTSQKRKTYIITLLSMPVERKVYKALQANSKLQGLLLDLI